MLFAAVTSLSNDLTRTTFEWGRIQSPADWVAPVAICLALLTFVVLMYRRDSVDLHPLVAVLLTCLRMTAFLGLLLVYLQPQWRNEQDQVFNSRVVLLVDTSLSMALHDSDASGVPAEPSRSQQVAAALADGKFLNDLRKTHDVAVARFDQETARIVSLDKRPLPGAAKVNAAAPAKAQEPPADWPAAIAATGTETRLGDALRRLLEEERQNPLAGIVVLTDGQSNAGLEPSVAIELAREAKIPVYPIGLGSRQQPVNVRISDLVAPARAYPGDSYTATGYLQAQGLAGQTVQVEILSRDAASPAPVGDNAGQIVGAQEVTLGGDGEVVPVKFELTPDEVGRRTLRLRVRPPAADRQETDNQQEVDIEVVDRKSRILLFAGGPSREYQFLRNQLRRDKDVAVDVLLQTGVEGISQDANEILEEFPATREELFEYDCIVAFDPDWRDLSATQLDDLTAWVGDQAGGLIVIAGPIYTDAWAQDPAMAKIRNLYPVEFNRRFSLLDDGRYGSEEPWPVEFSREGLEAEFLWIDESAATSARAWSEFEGVYGYYAVRGSKPGAVVYGRFTDPRAAESSQKPVYLAGQFFGSGRVFYLGSGEIWRLRRHEDAYFERFYTKLVRHVSQGRLLRGSHRGVLLVERDRYLVGSSVDIRAQLTNARLEPLEAATVNLDVILPDSTSEIIVLAADPSRAGTYRGQFTVRKEGVYRLELAVPESDEDRLSRRIQVKVPDLERENPQRNDALLSELALKTGGKYFVGLSAALAPVDEQPPLVSLLRDQSRTVTLAARPTALWDNVWVLVALCGVLCVEWLTRRLVKLA